MAGPFRDFIPDGEDAGALGSGFSDFVPSGDQAKAKKVDDPDTLEDPVLYRCPECDFITQFKVALHAHTKKHQKKE